MVEPVAVPPAHAPWLERFFASLVDRRWWIVTAWALLLVPAIYFGAQVTQDNSLDKLIVAGDPQAVTMREFAATFGGGGDYVVIGLEAEDLYAPAVLARADEIEHAIAALPGVTLNSALSTYRRARAGFAATREGAEDFRRFATGTTIFRSQGLVGDHLLAIALTLETGDAIARRAVVERLEATLAPWERAPAPLTAVRKVGAPLVNAMLDRDSSSAGWRYFPLFGLFVVLINLALYRSWRALFAILITLGVTAACTLGLIGATGGVFTIVSSLVPMTVLITCTATLVYIHSRYVECPEDRSPEQHQPFALANKFVASTASIFAGAVGFAALTVSQIKPIRDLGLWVAAGLVLTWLVAFTLFPALQRILRTPTMQERNIAGRFFLRYAAALPAFSYRARWVMVSAALALCVAGVIALTGIPGLIAPMHLETDAVNYIDHDTTLYRDTRRFESQTAGLSTTEAWLRNGRPGSVTDIAVLRGLERFESLLRAQRSVGAVVGVPTIAALMRYAAGEGDGLPADDAGLQRIADQLDARLANEPMLNRFIDAKTLASTHLTVITRTTDHKGFVALEQVIRECWKQSVAGAPALAQFELIVTGISPMQAKVPYHLVPTLVESFALSIGIIYGAFLLVFRSGLARLLAMIPSVMAILGMFVFMRLTGIDLNIATIIIASTVLGASENDQIHFFFHYQELRRGSTTEAAMRHTLAVVSRAILFATLINAGGFLAFTLAPLPPIRQFGLLSSIAFLLSLIADFTALPAALWLLSRQRPLPPQASRPTNDGATREVSPAA